MDRFYRDYKLIITTQGIEIEINPPLRIVFRALKMEDATLSRASINIFNLKSSTRELLSKTETDNKLINVKLFIGYDKKLELLFNGDVNRGYSKKQSAENVTSLEIFDGGFDYFNSFTSKTVTAKDQAVESILEDMPNTAKGKITTLRQSLRPKVLVGNSYHLIPQVIGNDTTYYIDNGQLFVTKRDDVISSYEPLVTGATGLLNTPQKKGDDVIFDTMLNPSLRLAGKCVIQSSYNKDINGLYKISKIDYVGDYAGNDWKQQVSCRLLFAYEVI